MYSTLVVVTKCPGVTGEFWAVMHLAAVVAYEINLRNSTETAEKGDGKQVLISDVHSQRHALCKKGSISHRILRL